MRLGQQVKLLVLLSLFSVGFCVSTFCMANGAENGEIPFGLLFGEVEEDESKEELEKVELIAALFEAVAFDVLSANSMDGLPGNRVLTPQRVACRPDSSRAPPASCC